MLTLNWKPLGLLLTEWIPGEPDVAESVSGERGRPGGWDAFSRWCFDRGLKRSLTAPTIGRLRRRVLPPVGPVVAVGPAPSPPPLHVKGSLRSSLRSALDPEPLGAVSPAHKRPGKPRRSHGWPYGLRESLPGSKRERLRRVSDGSRWRGSGSAGRGRSYAGSPGGGAEERPHAAARTAPGGSDPLEVFVGALGTPLPYLGCAGAPAGVLLAGWGGAWLRPAARPGRPAVSGMP